MTKQNARKKPGPKPKPKVEDVPVEAVVAPDADAKMDALEAERAEIAKQAAEPEVKAEEANSVTSEPDPIVVNALDEIDDEVREAIVEAVASHPAPSLPLIDGVEPAWVDKVVVGARSIQFIARPDVDADVPAHALKARSVTLPGHAPIDVAARAITPPAMRPVRVTLTVRERIDA